VGELHLKERDIRKTSIVDEKDPHRQTH